MKLRLNDLGLREESTRRVCLEKVGIFASSLTAPCEVLRGCLKLSDFGGRRDAAAPDPRCCGNSGHLLLVRLLRWIPVKACCACGERSGSRFGVGSILGRGRVACQRSPTVPKVNLKAQF